MQPQVPEGSLANFRNAAAEPDAIDVLITSRNHDLKAARCANSEPEHWLFALVSLQTMQGFPGAGKYGISRMNGGFASRPAVGLVTSPLPGGLKRSPHTEKGGGSWAFLPPPRASAKSFLDNFFQPPTAMRRDR